VPKGLTSREIEEFRTSLCEVAARLFAERGFEAVTLRSLAAELGCSPMTPYRYFANKEEILRAVKVAGFQRFGARIEKEATRYADPVERFAAITRAYLSFALDEPHMYRTMFQLDDQNVSFDEEARELVGTTWLPLLDTIQELIDAGHLEGDANTLGHVAWVMVHGAATLHLSGKLIFERSLDDIVEPMIRAFLQGSSARPAEALLR